jgi:hypothetical protein
MFQRKLIFLFLILFISNYSIAQVNLQTGSATFSLPVFNWQDNKSRLNSMIALSYSSGNGLKVNELASNVGQGWSLIAGGVIVRMQVGEPDDQWARSGNEWDVTKYPPGILYATEPASKGCPTALTKYPIFGWKNQLYNKHNVISEDKELDYFSFQFNGKAGMFVIDPTDVGNCKSLGDTKMKITFLQDANLVNQGIRTRISSFTIQDVDGLIYKFANRSLTKVLKAEYCDPNLIQYQRQPKFQSGGVYHQAGFDGGSIVNPWVVGSWYLTEIEDALTHRKVIFNYSTRTISNSAGEDIIYNQNKNYSIIFHKKSITQTPALNSISYPDGHSAIINYGAARLDLLGDFAISSMDVTYQGRYLSKHELNTSYFILNRYGTPISDYQKRVSRLCLMSVRKIGPDLKDDTPPYKFEYYAGSNIADDFVPPPFFYASDIWGFYNGNYSVGFNNESIPLNDKLRNFTNNQLKGLCYLRDGAGSIALNSKPGYAKNGLLKQIIYPTGGTLSYEYEQNKGVINGPEQVVGGVHVSKTSSTDGGFSNGCNNPLSTQYDYVMNGPGSASSLWGLEMPVNSKFVSNHYQPEWKSYKWSLSCFPFGCCYWHFQYPGIETMQQAIDLPGWQRLMETLSPVLGIISVISTIQDAITAFSGGNPVSLIIDVVLGLFQVAITCIGNQSRDSGVTMVYNTNFNNAAPLPTQFKRVEITESSGGIGKTVQLFTSSDDFPVWEPLNPNFSAKQRFAPWAYGLPKLTTVLDVNGFKVKETENIYDSANIRKILNYCEGPLGHGMPCNSSGLRTNLVSCNCDPVKMYSQRNTDWADPVHYNPASSYLTSSTSDLKVDYYGMYTGRVQLIATKERSFKPNSSTEYLEAVSEYYYNQSNYEVRRVSTTEANGNKKFKSIGYSCDFISNAGILSTLVQNNILSLPVETSNSILMLTAPYTWQLFYLDDKVTEYTLLSNGDIKPYRILEQRFDKPMPTYNPGGPVYSGYQGPASNSNPAYKETQFFTYDAAGNLKGIKDEGSRQVTNIYDYDDKYIVASVINANSSTDYSAYTSFETSSFGGWNVIRSGTPNTSLAVTGSASYTFIPGKQGTNPTLLRASLNTAKPYIVSFWANTATITLSSGATLVKSAPTINGFTYYEYNISQGISIISVTGTGTVDELRCYPQTARMRTVAYDPVIGKITECDENNRVTYFEYDRLGRLQLIKDEKRNIVKMYEYNNISASKQNGCPGIYYNRQLSEIFTKNNCTSGSVGTDVTFTVPANIYSSTLSQSDADAQAEAYLLANGQNYANTNGTCRIQYFNTQQSQNFTTESCGPGYIGGSVAYIVPAGRYSSLISLSDANQQALDEIESNGEAFANTPPNAVCIPDANPLWVWQEGASWYCAIINGDPNPHLIVQETDINPNSSTYMTTRWSDTGPSDMCQTGLYYNTLQSASFTRNNCPQGYIGSTVTYTVQPGTYSSGLSQNAADQLALNDISANGQNYANSNGTCTQGCDPNYCIADEYKCINNTCEQGIRVNTDSYYNGNQWVCIYHYEFSDGSWSANILEYNYTMCPL